MKELVYIKIKDICYYGDDFEYPSFFVEKCDNFEEKMKQFEEICKNYEDFQQVKDFIEENFTQINFETIEIFV